MMFMGETLRDAEKPPQPAHENMAVSARIKQGFFQFIFTGLFTIVRFRMFATSDSRGTSSPRQRLPRRFYRALFSIVGPGWLMVAAILIFRGQDAEAQVDPKPPGDAAFAKQAEQAYDAAKARFQAATNNLETGWQFARACFDWADYATNDAKRATVANEGIAASRKVIEASTNSVPGHYYLALNLGQLARTKSLGALKIVGQMEAEFKITLALDPQYDFGGPDRGLGLLYLDTPGWPLSLGGKSKAREHLEAALKLAPDFPENRLNLIEADLNWGDKKSALAGLKALEEIWPEARKKLTGEAWAASWSDWEKRRAAAQKKAAPPRK